MTNRIYIRDSTEVVLVATPDKRAQWAGLRANHPALVGYFSTLFENLWAQALPATQQPTTLAGEALSGEDLELLELLLSGLTDTSIARSLGVSLRTVQRRAQTLQRRLGVSGRFQLGLRVGLGEIQAASQPPIA